MMTINLARLFVPSAILVLLASCDLIASLPLIRTFPAGFASTSPTMVLASTITQRGNPLAPALTVACEVALQLGPERFSATTTIAGTRMAGSVWNCTLPAAVRNSVRASQVISFRWQVFSTDSAGAPLKVAESPFVLTLLDCPNFAAAMAAEQASVTGQFGALTSASQLRDAGFVPAHGAASFTGMGVAFIRGSPNDLTAAIGLDGSADPVLGSPNLLLYAPAAGAAATTDVLGFDEPMSLIGWAYAKPIGQLKAMPQPPDGRTPLDVRPQQPRPALACIPHHEWLIHAEGVHKVDGTFNTGFADSVTVPETNLTVPVPAQGIPHPALWDLHIFARPNGVAEISLFNRIPGNFPPVGVPVSTTAFYYPTVYD